ncbi:hypothetical protein RN001_002258 [Aquatica leii]|uniref:SH3 domain-binding protein 5-like n=1 Tax=Aquatica leii TaxID=1421715 RepID=A0AAN7PGU2_9COLE|nr:hypothetical protein RN001_002258 [Aquatica leii]
MCENGAEYFDSVDPRVQIELERLNNATDEINRLEVELDECRAAFRLLLCESTAKVDALRLKLGLCVERAKPYYESRFCANEALKQTQIAAMRYERANSAHSAAREMVYLAEQGLGGRTLDPAWQEMLNHATQRVNDAERERAAAGQEHRIACVKHEAANAKVQSLQKELKRAIAKSSLSIRRSFMLMSSLAYRHDLIFLPYFEMKAQFNQMLEHQKMKVQTLDSLVTTSKLTYADALRNLEQISDEIHKSRSKSNSIINSSLNISNHTNFTNSTYSEDINSLSEEYKGLPSKLNHVLAPINNTIEEVDGYKTVNIGNSASISPMSQSEKSDSVGINCDVNGSRSNEWTEINLDVSSPEEDLPYLRLETDKEDKPKLVRQKTLPNPKIEHEFSSIKSKMKLDATISNWISRSSAKNEVDSLNSRRQSLDNILGPTGEKVKEIFSQGMMMLNIASLTERRNSEPKLGITDDKSKSSLKKLPSPLEKTVTYLAAEEDSSDTESLASVDMLTEDQINSLMLDKDIGQVCEQVLGTNLSDVVPLPCTSSQR